MNAAAIAEEIMLAPSVLAGSLRFWGDWFGRPHDNVHRISRCMSDGNMLSIYFDNRECLTVHDPSRAKVGPHDFYIANASRVRWEWFYYGRPPTPQNLYFLEYVRTGSAISGTTNVDWYKPSFRTSPEAKAVEIL